MAQRAASRVPALVRRLRGGSPAQQLTAADALRDLLVRPTREQVEAVSDAILAAGAVPLLVLIVSASQSEELLNRVAEILSAVACASPRRSGAILAAGGVAALVQLMGGASAELISSSSNGLVNITAAGGEAARAAAAAAGAIPVAVRLLSGRAGIAESAARLLGNLTADSPARQQAVHSAGGIEALVRCLRRDSSDAEVHSTALTALYLLAHGSPERCQAIVAAGGARACVHMLAPATTVACKAWAAELLCALARLGQSAAVVAADPCSSVEAALEWRLQRQPPIAEEKEELEAALRALAAARQAPPRVCAAPGCGATAGLRRCAGCGSVRYCSEACLRAHWRAHRPECKRLRAAGSGSAAVGPSQQP